MSNASSDRSASLTIGQRSVLEAIHFGVSQHGSRPQARGRIVASLFDRGLVTTGGYGKGGGFFADLSRWRLTESGRDALNG